MENTETVCTHAADLSLPQEQLPWSRSTSRERSLLRKMGEGTAIKDNVIIVEKVGIWPMCALINIKLQLVCLPVGI